MGMKSLLDDTEWKLNADSDDSVRAFYMPASVMRDSELSCKAKVVWSYMNARPAYWDFSAKRIAESMKEAYKAIQGALRELEGRNYLSRKRQGDGRIAYKLETSPPVLTEEEAIQCLVETFPDYYCKDEDFICTNDAIEELKAEGWKDGGRVACDWSKACDEAKIGQSKHSWKVWKAHAVSMGWKDGYTTADRENTKLFDRIDSLSSLEVVQ